MNSGADQRHPKGPSASAADELKEQALAAHDRREGYCRLLGHHVPFSYCRATTNGLPCRLVLDCWDECFAVRRWLTEHFSAPQIQTILTPPKPKIATLIELIEKAKKAE